MAKASINTGDTAQPVHTRTTAGTEESQAAVIAIDGSDSVVPADTANGLDVDVTRVQGTVTTSVIGSTTSTVVAVTATTTTGTVLKAANTGRVGLYIYNASTAVLYLKFGATATTTSYSLQIPAGGFYEIPIR